MKTSFTKNIFKIIIISFTLIACETPSDISGKLENVKNKNLKIYLIQPEKLRDVSASYLGKVIDSATVQPDGGFEFNNLPKAKTPVLFELALQQPDKHANYLQTDNPAKSNFMPIVWEPGKPIKITSTLSDFQNHFSIENPSEINRALLDLKTISQKAYQTHLSGKHWDLKDGDQLLDKEHSMLQYQTALIHFANNTPHLLPALVATRWVSPVNDYERVPEFLVNQCNTWTKKTPNHPWVQQLCKLSKPENLPVLIGDEFPNITLPTINNDSISIKNQLGSKLTIIDLWASWCAPCRKENRDVLVPLWDTYHNKGLQVIAYALESNRATWLAAAEHDGANRWIQISDLQGDDAPFLKSIRVQTIPANFILNDKGVVIAKNIHREDLINWVKNYIK
ncbi:TlpA family protein disulfide reductase [Algibacter pacificus]|uniref:TlpA family protein disulfide reductase n=1 Tax=Algibacter pacificus TaxID=2599389 RepID=UPI0011C789BD|nr:TlpA disulfide reductase family protein [Algibacter pacificus]